MIERTARFKLCPGCGKITDLDSPVCEACGHLFRTDFTEPKNGQKKQPLYKVIDAAGRESPPRTEQEVVEAARRGEIVPATPLYDFETARWLAAADLPALGPVFAPPPPPPPAAAGAAPPAEAAAPPEIQVAPFPAPQPKWWGGREELAVWITGALLCAVLLGLLYVNRGRAGIPADGRQGGDLLSQVSLSRVWLVDSVTPTGEYCQRVLVRWRNLGPEPIRHLAVNIEARAKAGGPLMYTARGYTMYAVEDSQPGIQAGETYQTPENQGYVLYTTPRRRAGEVLVQLSAASDQSLRP